MSTYEPTTDYASYTVGDDDSPFVRCAEAARMLGGLSTEAVRKMISRGSLPARRGAEYNAPYLIPRWAVLGLVGLRGGGPGSDDPIASSAGLPRKPARDADTELSTPMVETGADDRIRRLEDALLAVRAAGEHARNANRLQQEATRELRTAYEMLESAMTAVVLPFDAANILAPDSKA